MKITDRDWGTIWRQELTPVAPHRSGDLDRTNQRRVRRQRRSRFLIRAEPVLVLALALLPALVVLAIGLR